MFKRRVPFVAALSPLAMALLLMAPGASEAVELGTLELQSGSGQPLVATIALSDTEGLSADDIRVQLASVADFERFSLERLAALETLQIAVDFSGSAPVLRLSSPVTISEPFLSLVLDTRWPAGRVLTEYMVRLDSPAFSAGSALTSSSPIRTEAVTADSASTNSADTDGTATPNDADTVLSNAPVAGVSGASTAATANTATSGTVPAAATTNPAPVVSNASTITVNAGDTLWELAQRVRPDNSVTVQQTMLALQRLNPEAFIAGNINRVRRGEVLQVPELSEIRRIAATEAVSEVTRQNREFASGTATAQPVTAPPSAAPAGAGAQGELRVVTVEDEDETPSQQANTGASGNQATQRAEQIEALEDRIAVREDDLARLDAENEELNARLALLQQQIAAAQEIIRLRDLELAQLQQRLAQEGNAVSTPSVEPPVITMAPEGGPIQRLMYLLTSNTWAMLGAAAVLVLLLVLLMVRRNRSAALAKAQATARENDTISLGNEDEELLFSGVAEAAADAANRSADATAEGEKGSDSSETEAGSETEASRQATAAYLAVEDSRDEADDAEADFDKLIQQELKHGAETAESAGQTEAADDWQPDDFDDTGTPGNDPYQLDDGDASSDQTSADPFAPELPREGAVSLASDIDEIADAETGADLSWPDEERPRVGDEFDISLPDEDKPAPELEPEPEPEPELARPAARTPVADEFDDLAFLPSEDEFTDQSIVADEDEEDFGFLNDSDEVATKLDLARAYIDMGDSDGAREILDEVLREGTEEQRKEAQDLLGRL